MAGFVCCVKVRAGEHQADTTALLLRHPEQKQREVILLCAPTSTLEVEGMLVEKVESWEVSRFIKPRGVPASENARVLRLCWGSLPVTMHGTRRSGESCSRDVHRRWPGGFLSRLAILIALHNSSPAFFSFHQTFFSFHFVFTVRLLLASVPPPHRPRVSPARGSASLPPQSLGSSGSVSKSGSRHCVSRLLSKQQTVLVMLSKVID